MISAAFHTSGQVSVADMSGGGLEEGRTGETIRNKRRKEQKETKEEDWPETETDYKQAFLYSDLF